MRRSPLTLPTVLGLGLVLSLLPSLGFKCGGGTTGAPTIQVSLNGIDGDLNDFLVVPPSNVWITATFAGSDAEVDPASFSATLVRLSATSTDISGQFILVNETRATGLLSTDGNLPPGSYHVSIEIADLDGDSAQGGLSFAVRDFPTAPPIGTGQTIWLDFASDRDAVAGSDFAVDLESFGLASSSSPVVSATARNWVEAAVLARVEQAYYDEDPIGFGLSDAVQVAFSLDDPGPGDVTRICVGGSDPSGQGVIGTILIDPQNGNKSSVECGTLPPTGIFPREMTIYGGQADYQNAFAAVLTSLGGTPVGEHPYDAVVVNDLFDPQSTTPPLLARWNEIQWAITNFSNALGSIVAHEAGHALGLVAPGAPGVGIHGGSVGLEFSHDVTSDGTTSPAPNYLMKHGGNFTFGRLAGMSGNPLPYLRPIDHAYLRDRVVLDASVTELLLPPIIDAASPTSISGTVQLTVTGASFAATPSLRLVGSVLTYELLGEQLVSPNEVTGWIVGVQVPADTYDLVVTNPDGQSVTMPSALVVTP